MALKAIFQSAGGTTARHVNLSASPVTPWHDLVTTISTDSEDMVHVPASQMGPMASRKITARAVVQAQELLRFGTGNHGEPDIDAIIAGLDR